MSLDLGEIKKLLADPHSPHVPILFAEDPVGDLPDGPNFFDLFVDLRKFTSMKIISTEIAKRLSFPYPDGWNWNAFSDQLSDLSWLNHKQIVIVISSTSLNFSSLDTCAFLNVFQYASLTLGARSRLLLVIV